MDHENHMRHALRLAENARAADEVPIGAVIVREDQLLGEGYNQNIFAEDPTAHGEVVALREACAYLNNYRLTGPTTLYVTLEPCPMCFYAMVHARVARLVYGAPDPKTGYTQFFDADHLARFNHQIEVIPGVSADECAEVLRTFFREKRDRGKRKWIKQAHQPPEG